MEGVPLMRWSTLDVWKNISDMTVTNVLHR